MKNLLIATFLLAAVPIAFAQTVISNVHHPAIAAALTRFSNSLLMA